MAYVALLAFAAVDAAGYGVLAPVVPAIADETGAGPAIAGTLVAAFAAGQLAGFPLAGRLVTERPAARVLAAGLVLVAAGDLGFVLGDGLGAYFPARLVQGVGAGALWMGVVFAVLERFPGQEYRRLSGILAAYSAGGIAGPGLAAVGGVAGPFALHLALVVAAAGLLPLLRPRAARPAFGSDRAALRTRGFRIASVGVLLVALGVGVVDGPLPLHLATRLGQAEIAAFYVAASLVLGLAAAGAGTIRPRRALALGAAATVTGLAAVGAVVSVPLWALALGVAMAGLGAGETGALGILLEEVGVERIVGAMVVWSQLWAVGYLVGPAVAGAVAEALGFAALGLVPAVGAALLALVALPRRSDPLTGTVPGHGPGGRAGRVSEP